MVADILLLKKVIEQPAKKAILVLPYVALVQEKLKWLRRVVGGVTKQVDTKGRPILNRTFHNASQHKPVFDLTCWVFLEEAEQKRHGRMLISLPILSRRRPPF